MDINETFTLPNAHQSLMTACLNEGGFICNLKSYLEGLFESDEECHWFPMSGVQFSGSSSC